MPQTRPANDPSHSPDDICDQLRKDHESVLARLDAIRSMGDARRCEALLRELRQAWVIHALAEETVVYRALEGEPMGERSDERFVEHELVGGLFDSLIRMRPGTHEWKARLNVVADLMRRHIDTETDELFSQLASHFDGEGLRQMGERFRLACDKLHLLEDLKAA